jgi:hypothetical protein
VFSIERDPLTECFMRVVAGYPKTNAGAAPQGAASFFTAPSPGADDVQALPKADLIDRFLALAAARGAKIDREVLAAALAECERQPLVTAISPFRYTIA